jgi:cytoskeletal protein RodZ
MKSKLIVAILALALLLCQGIVFAESTEAVETAKATTGAVETVKATAEDVVTGEDDSLDMIVEEDTAAPADELYTPEESETAETAVAEAKKM